ncbi:transglycosylase domain-containing protein [Stackebrandtia soli]|uniref:transglycosylase domain-containing protein n=1 Tax=Stackebrandtia soli TaxID=1892856 RepID=UPI0039EBF49E
MAKDRRGRRAWFQFKQRWPAVWRLLRLSLITGLALAAGLMPLIGMSGMAAKAAADSFITLPPDFSLPPTPKASTVYASDGKTVVAKFGDQYRIEAESDEISQVMRDAIVAAEDVRFYEHNGVDSKGIARALIANFTSGEVTEGASTITMQYVRQVLAYSATTPEEVQAATATTPQRKLREMRYAIAVEQEMSKDEILTNYLNTVYFGHGAYGIGAAAQVYFDKPAAELELAEAALLAGLVQSPSEYDPISGDPDAAKDRRGYVLERMETAGYIDRATAREITDADIELDPGKTPGDGFGALGSDYGFFADYFEHWWSQQKAFGDTPQERLGLLNRGGFTIVSSLDVDLQQDAEDAIAANQSKDSPYALGSAAVEPGTGLVRVLAVNRNYNPDASENGAGNYPNTTNPLLTGGNDFAGYQAGSTFKMFTMLAALEEGMKLDTTIYSPHRYTTKYPGGGGTSSCGMYWCPANDNPSMTGSHTMWSAFGRSVNTYFVQLIERVGADKAVEMAERLGLTWRTDADQAQADKADTWGAFTLGVSSTTPLELASAYATLAADGVRAEPTPVERILDSQGATLTMAPRTEKVLDVEVARAAVDAARCPTGYGAASGGCGGGGTASYVSGMVGGPVAGKTGTTDSNSTAWFAGFTPNLAVASFMADPDNPSNFLGGGMTGMPTNVSARILAASWADDPDGEFTEPKDLVGQNPYGWGPPPGEDDGDPGDDPTDPETPGPGGPSIPGFPDPSDPTDPDPSNPGGPSIPEGPWRRR